MSEVSKEIVGTSEPRKGWFRKTLALAVIVAVMAALVTLGGWLLEPLAVRQIEGYTGTKASVESASLSFGGVLRLKNLKMTTEGEKPSLILEARRVYVKLRILSLLRGKVELKSLTVTGGLLNAEYDSDGRSWNLASLVRKSEGVAKMGGRLPKTEVTNSTVQVSKRSGGSIEAILSMPLSFEAEMTSDGGYLFHIRNIPTSYQRSLQTKSWTIRIDGQAGSLSRPGEFWLEAAMDNLILSNEKVEGELRVGRELAEVLHESLVKLWDRYSPDGVVDVKASLSGSLTDVAKGQVRATFMFRDVSLRYVHFPYLLEHVKGDILFENGDLWIDELKGEHGETKVTITGYSRGSGPTWESQVKIHSDRAIIDDDVYMALNTEQKKVWFMFSPSGTTALDFEYRSEKGQNVLTRATLHLIDGQMMYEHFPYRFRHGRGTLIFEPNEVRLKEVVSREAGSETRFSGEITNLLSHSPDVNVRVNTRNLPIEAKLLSDSIGEERLGNLDRLDFAGRTDADLLVTSVQEPEWCIQYAADANFTAPELKYLPAGISLADVSAKVGITPTYASVDSLKGTYGGGTVSMKGRIEIPRDANATMCYRLGIDGNNVTIDEGLRNLVPEKNLPWHMRPSGKINFTASFDSCTGKGLEKLAIECVGANVDLEQTGYRLGDMAGRIIIGSKATEFEALKCTLMDAEGRMEGTARLEGRMAIGDNRLEEVDIGLDAQDLRFGKALKQVSEVLSPGLYDVAEPNGTVDLKSARLLMSRDPNGLRFGSFSGQIVFRDCSFGREELSNINAELNLTGFFEREMILGDVKADLDAHTITIRGKTLTNVQSRVEYYKGQKRWSIGNFRGDCYDGRITGDVIFSADEGQKFGYSLKASFEGVSLGRFLAKGGSDPNTASSGIMKGQLAVKGQLSERRTRRGTLALDVANMRIGRMSLMAKIFTLLSLAVPGDVAFHTMKMDSELQGEELLIRSLRMSGDALNFEGAGKVNLENHTVDIDLAATTPTPAPGFLTSAMAGLRHAVVYLKVRGKLDDPVVTVTPLPILDKAIEKVLGTPK